MNAIMTDTSGDENYDLVPTATLGQIVDRVGKIDLLKLDGEGAEYDILFAAGERDLRSVAEIRMECHQGPRAELIARLTTMGYVLSGDVDEGGVTACFDWFENRHREQDSWSSHALGLRAFPHPPRMN